MIEIPIVFQNSEIVVVDKPVGLSIHNGESSELDSDLISILCSQLDASKMFPVHRLDKETSGLQIVALSSEAASIWAQEFQNDRVLKFYEGVARGTLSERKGTWLKPITDRSEGRVNPAGLSSNRVPAETRFQVLGSNKYFSRVRYELITGRQHQIRKHSAIYKHPLVGDRRYGDQNYNARMTDIYGTDRMFLHSARIHLRGKVFECPAPPEFDKLVALELGT
jgi:RluA family pseudouridine synthase